jgi:hypothetical protein
MNAELQKWIDEALFGQDDLCVDCIHIDKIRALFDGKVLVPVDALGDVLNLAGYSVTHTDFDSSLRKSFIDVADLIAASQEQGKEQNNE